MDKKVYEFISKQMNDPIIERRTCAWTGEKFAIYQGDVDLLDKISPVIGGKKMDIPFPTLSPLARMRRRMMFRNERGLYMRQSALSGKKVISMYHPDMVRDVVLPQEIYSNEYDPLSWGISFDAQVPFFAQYRTLQENIARP